jgi:hypothetical protein
MVKIKRFFTSVWKKVTAPFGNGPRQLGFTDMTIFVAAAVLMAGLSMVYFPLGLILPAAIYLGWEAFRRWPREGR